MKNEIKKRMSNASVRTHIKNLIRPAQELFDQTFANIPISKIGGWLVILWNTSLAAAYVNYIFYHKLELDKYFPSIGDIRDSRQIANFLTDKTDTLVLCTVLFAAWLFLTRDSLKWVAQAERCFSILNKPRRWRAVRGRWIIVWVVLSNIVIYVALAYFTDNVSAFSALFMVHHLNAVVWLRAFRRNVRYYFHSNKFNPPRHDQQKQFILRRRAAIETFLCKTHNITREAATSGAYGLAFVFSYWNHSTRALPFVVIAIAESTNQLISYKERHDRDARLWCIEEDEEMYLTKKARQLRGRRSNSVHAR